MSDEDSSTLGRLQDAAIRTVDRVIDDGEQQLEDDSFTLYQKNNGSVII